MTLTPITPAPSGAREYRGLSSSGVSIMPAMDPASRACCGEPGGPEEPDGPEREKPGYTLCPWVADFISTPAGEVPRVKTRLDLRDRLTTGVVRCGIGRYTYTVSPGLYAVGHPDPESDVVVTANFKLTFDQLRCALDGLDLWVLVLDTKGINVWCAAGKGTFATKELTARITSSGLDQVVAHRRLILPQLGATGVSAGSVRKDSGFRVVYGPVRAEDIPAFLAAGRKTAPGMRDVTFTFAERLILTPVELQIALKPALITALVILVLSGIGPGLFSFSAAWNRGLTGLLAMGAGLVSGAVITPALLPHIPVREFALKGIITGIVAAGALLAAHSPANFVSGLALVLFTITISSFMAMNFTGTTPFTSPSGVEKEMKRYIPGQLAGLVLAAGCWIWGGF